MHSRRTHLDCLRISKFCTFALRLNYDCVLTCCRIAPLDAPPKNRGVLVHDILDRRPNEANAVCDPLGPNESMEQRLAAAGEVVGHVTSVLPDLEYGGPPNSNALVTAMEEFDW